jgi:putative transposase
MTQLNILENPELLEKTLKACITQEDIFGKQGLLQSLIKRALQAALDAELEEHLGYKKHEKHEKSDKSTGNSRNGTMKKTLKGSNGNIEIATPRDRNGTFEPIIVEKNQTRFEAFDDKILALYAKVMTTRDI